MLHCMFNVFHWSIVFILGKPSIVRVFESPFSIDSIDRNSVSEKASAATKREKYHLLVFFLSFFISFFPFVPSSCDAFNIYRINWIRESNVCWANSNFVDRRSEIESGGKLTFCLSLIYKWFWQFVQDRILQFPVGFHNSWHFDQTHTQTHNRKEWKKYFIHFDCRQNNTTKWQTSRNCRSNDKFETMNLNINFTFIIESFLWFIHSVKDGNWQVKGLFPLIEKSISTQSIQFTYSFWAHTKTKIHQIFAEWLMRWSTNEMLRTELN